MKDSSMINSVRGVTLASLGQYGETYDEDCLNVNVWTKPQSGEKAKAVLLWIYVRVMTTPQCFNA